MSRFFAMEERELENIVALHNDLEKIKAEASRKEINEITAIIKSEIENMGELFEIKNGVAHIPIVGQLSEKPSMTATLFGGDQTTYGSIIDNIKVAGEDPTVKEIVFEIDTPGGTVSGLDQTGMAIRAIKKPTTARVHNMAASAGYWLAAQTKKIMAITPTAEFGSIGVAAEVFDNSKRDEKDGIKKHTIVSTGAENKRTDISTKDGRDKIKDRLTEIHDIFVTRVAEGRGVSEKTVRKDFGNGGVLIAGKALGVGMIDEIIDGNTIIKTEKEEIAESEPPARGAGKINEEVSNMTRAELKAQYPALEKEIFEAGEKAGEDRERVRIEAHAEWFDVSPKEVMAAIVSGEKFTVKHSSRYAKAQLNKRDLDDRDADDTGDTTTKKNDQDGGNAIFATALKEELGIEEAV